MYANIILDIMLHIMLHTLYEYRNRMSVIHVYIILETSVLHPIYYKSKHKSKKETTCCQFQSLQINVPNPFVNIYNSVHTSSCSFTIHNPTFCVFTYESRARNPLKPGYNFFKKSIKPATTEARGAGVLLAIKVYHVTNRQNTVGYMI